MLPWAAKSSILWFLGSHSLDTLRWIVGSEIKRVYCVSSSGVLAAEGVDTVDVYQSTLEFENGVIAQMENGWITPSGNPCVNDIKFNVVGDKGMISVDASNHNLIQKYTDRETVIPDVLVNHSVFDKPKGFAFESIRSFVDSILTGEEFKVTLDDAVKNCAVIFALFESAQKRMPVEVKY